MILKINKYISEVTKAKNPGELEGIYWRIHSFVSNSDFPAKDTYLKALNAVEKLDYSIMLDNNKGKIKGVLDHILDDIDNFDNNNSDIQAKVVKATIKEERLNITNENKVFIVHGHNELMKQSVARFIEKIGLEAVILHEQPNRGLTIVEKFILNSNVCFAIVLLSADDIGYSKKEGKNKSKERARQNVIFELGYFIAKLERHRVVALVENANNFELPSDYHGIIYINYDSSDKWKNDLSREILSNGIKVDVKKIF